MPRCDETSRYPVHHTGPFEDVHELPVPIGHDVGRCRGCGNILLLARISRRPALLDSSLFLQPGLRVIGIDGEPAAGKTFLANEIHGFVGGTVLHLDDFLCSKGDRPYLSQYKASNLPQRFREMLKGLSGLPVIIEGCELLDALDFLQAKADFLVVAEREADDTIDLCWLDYCQRRQPLKMARLHTELCRRWEHPPQQ